MLFVKKNKKSSKQTKILDLRLLEDLLGWVGDELIFLSSFNFICKQKENFKSSIFIYFLIKHNTTF